MRQEWTKEGMLKTRNTGKGQNWIQQALPTRMNILRLHTLVDSNSHKYFETSIRSTTSEKKQIIIISDICSLSRLWFFRMCVSPAQIFIEKRNTY
jgi:hypothetical protein